MRYSKQEGLRDCGICCMQNIIKYHGGYIDIEKLREMTHTNENGTSIYNIVKVANEIGFESKAYKCEINDLETLKFPSIILIKLNSYNHFAILDNIEVDKITVYDPIRGKVNYKLDDFIKVWENIVITFDKKNEIVKERSYFNNYLLNILDIYKIQIIIIISLSIICSILGIGTSIYIKKIYDNKLPNNSFFMFAILLFIKLMFEYIRTNLSINLNNTLDYSLSNKVYKKIFSLPSTFHHTRPIGDITTKINDLYSIENFISIITLSSFIDLLIVVFILFIILFTNFRIFLIILFLSSLYVFIYYYCINEESKLISLNKEKRSIFNSFIVDKITGINSIKNLNIEDKVLEKQDNNKKEFLNSNKKLFAFFSIQNFVFSFIESYGALIILFVGYNLVKSNTISIGNLAFIYTLFVSYITSFKNLISLYKYYLDSKISYKRVTGLLNVNYVDNGKKNIKKVNSIKFEDMSYTYNSNKIISNFNLTINRGDYIFMNGGSGKGKSTIFKLLNKEYALKSGNIYIDGIDINEIKVSSIRNNICYVSQNEYIFNDSIKNNILMYKNIKVKELNKVLKATTLDKMLKKKNISLDYILEHNGNNLSGGEKQKILIARTLLRGTDYIIFDETMNEIDVETEKKIIENIKTEYDKTVVLISHRNFNSNLFNKRVTI